MKNKRSSTIIVTKDGPYVVSGAVPLAEMKIVGDSQGNLKEWKQGNSFEVKESYALCRCGKSGQAPFCDGTHAKSGFKGAETASKESFDKQKKTIDGRSLILEDAAQFCSSAGFCVSKLSVWDSMKDSGNPEIRNMIVKEVECCPSGRLVVREKETGKALEPKLPVSIGIVDDTTEKCSGPLWVRGGVQIESQDGESYEIRNRVTLCRCGVSKNKPFCDGSHIKAKYQDGR